MLFIYFSWYIKKKWKMCVYILYTNAYMYKGKNKTKKEEENEYK